MPTVLKAALIFLFILLPAGAFSLATNQQPENRASMPEKQSRNIEPAPTLDKRQHGQAARNHDLFQCRYLPGLLDQEWSQAYNSSKAQPSKDTMKHLRKDARTAERAVTRLMVDLADAKLSANPDESALSGIVPTDFISTLHRVIAI